VYFSDKSDSCSYLSVPVPTNTLLCAARLYVRLCTQHFCFRFAMQHYCILQCINLEVFTAADCIIKLTESILKMEAVHSFETSEHSASSRCRTQDNTVICPSIAFCNGQNTLLLRQGAPTFWRTTQNTSTNLLKLRCDHQTAGSSLVVLLSAPTNSVTVLQRNVWQLSCPSNFSS